MIKKSTAWLLVVVMILGLYVPGQVFALEGLGTVPAVESNLNGADPAQIAAPIQRVLTKTPYQFDQVATSVYGALGFKSTADTNGELWTWGERSNEWTGSDTEDNRDVPRLLKTNVRQFSAGGSFVVAVTNDSKLLYWGHNWKGENGNQATPDADAQLGIEIMTDVKMASAGDGYLMVLKNDDTLWTAGSNNYGQLGDGDVSTHWLQKSDDGY